MKYDFHNKVALVTGAGSGMGLSTAKAFADSGASVVLVDTRLEPVRAVANQLKERGQQALAFACDVTNEAQVKAMIEEVVATLGRLDAAFNNAGVTSRPTETADLTGDEFERVISSNLRGVWNCMKYELQQMVRQGSGTIVNNSSTAGTRAAPGLPAYVASKHGVLGLTKTAGLEYAKKGVRVNAVCPGMINTPMTDVLASGNKAMLEAMLKSQPLGRLGQPEEIAAAVLWLSSPGSSFVIGHGLAVDGGATA